MTSGNSAMRRTAAVAALVCLLALPLGSARAVGTAAGTPISNMATATYTLSGIPGSQNSNVEIVTVLEVIDVVVTSQDAGPVSVSTPDAGGVLTFLVTNVGNGIEDFALSVQNVVAPPDDFDPTSVAIYVDDDGTPGLNTATDTLYGAPSDVRLDANLAGADRLTVFVVGVIPAGLLDGDFSDVELFAVSDNHPGGSPAPGTLLSGAGDGGIDALLGTGVGDDSDQGRYLVFDVTVSMVKSVVSISDPFGGIRPVPGATIVYSIAVSVVGSTTAAGVTITDPIPVNTTYVAGSMTLDDGGGGGPAALTDVVDADVGDYDATPPPMITVRLGDLTSASPAQTINFSVTID